LCVSTSSAYRVVVRTVPNAVLLKGPSSLSCGTRSPFPSVHERFAVGFEALSGLLALARSSTSVPT
jgi:hypothetical protein